MSELDVVSDAIRLCSCERGYPVHPNVAHHLADAAVKALDAFRYSEKRKNCQHHNKRGSGMLGSDGSSKTTWYCVDCGASYSEETPARPAALHPLLFNAPVSRSLTPEDGGE